MFLSSYIRKFTNQPCTTTIFTKHVPLLTTYCIHFLIQNIIHTKSDRARLQIQWSNILLAIITIYVPWNSFWSFGSAPEGVRRTESIESQQWQSSPIPLQIVNNNLLTRKLHVRFYTMNYFFEICFPWLSLVVAFNNFQWPSSGPNEIPNRKLCKQHLNESTHEISRNLVDYILANGQVWFLT